ncbi:zinc finger protein 235-like [Macrobrachium nipponense]|uniref:zinc finger protein 235-like n=1 Tax=Macrobrachium nipponense TaxID=159736 RepID=UPI0030C8C88D
MSRSLNSFSVSDDKPMHPSSDFDAPSTFFNDASQTPETTFLSPQSEVPESFLNLGNHSRPGISPVPETVDGEQVLLNSNNEVMRDEVTTAPLLCLDPSTGLHVLVHNLCQTIQQPPEPQVDVAHEQFVVVWALQSEDEPMVLEKSLENTETKTSSLSEPAGIGTILSSPVMSLETSAVRSESVVQRIFSSSIEPSLDVGIEIPTSKNFDDNHGSCKDSSSHINMQEPTTSVVEEKIQQKNTSVIDCPNASMLTLQVAEHGKSSTSTPELQQDILLETVPHISLEEIIEKFTCESNHALHVLENEKTESVISVKKEAPTETIRKEPLTLQDNSVSSQGMCNVMVDERSNLRSKSNVTVKLKTSANVVEESLDEESFYDILMTYKCKLCSEVFIDKARLMKHYCEVHKSRKGVKIYVTSENVGSLSSLRSDSYSSSQKLKDLNLMSCRHCFRTFLGVKELQQHILHEHPAEVRKGTRKKKSKGVTSLPTQPGLLFGHRESRLSVQEDTEDEKNENQKRRIKTPKNLDEQYWLQKQKPPKNQYYLQSNKEKVLKCSVDHCRFRFSSEENVRIHEKCHGEPGERSEEKLFFCCECSGRFLKWGVCQMHLWKVHSIDVDLLTCGICLTYKTDAEQKLIIHQKIHSDVREYVCKVCNKAFRQHSQLLNHEVFHICNEEALPQWHQKAYCTKCEKWFFDSQTLKKHINTIHLKVKPHSCPHCPYKCTRKYDMGLHIRKHTQEKPHQCELCGHWYRDATTVRRHKWVHFLTKPLKCPLVTCQYESSHMLRFKKHINKYHWKDNFLYKCQTCSLEVADLQRYVRHVTLHEDQLFKEAMEKRANSAALPSTSVQLDGVALRLPVQSLVTGEADNIHIKIEAVDDRDHMESIGTENSHAGHSLPDNKQKAFVIEAGVVQNIDGNNSESFNDHSGRQNLPVKSPTSLCVTMGNTAIKAQAVDKERVRRINLIKEETTSSDSLVFESTDNAMDISSHNSQVFTINVDNMESADNFLKGTDNCNLVSYDLQKTAETRFDEVIKEDLLEGSPHGSSVLDVVQKGGHLEPKIIGDRRQENIVLNVIESTERTPILGVEEENQTLITLSQVMSDDGHQYIIGISPEEIAESQENIFSIGQNGH